MVRAWQVLCLALCPALFALASMADTTRVAELMAKLARKVEAEDYAGATDACTQCADTRPCAGAPADAKEVVQDFDVLDGPEKTSAPSYDAALYAHDARRAARAREAEPLQTATACLGLIRDWSRKTLGLSYEPALEENDTRRAARAAEIESFIRLSDDPALEDYDARPAASAEEIESFIGLSVDDPAFEYYDARLPAREEEIESFIGLSVYDPAFEDYDARLPAREEEIESFIGLSIDDPAFEDHDARQAAREEEAAPFRQARASPSVVHPGFMHQCRCIAQHLSGSRSYA